MPLRAYRQYPNIRIDGNDFYIGAVERCLNKIAAQSHGPKFLRSLNGSRNRVTIQQAGDGGNSCSPQSDDVSPLLLQYIKRSNSKSFSTELRVAIKKAERAHITLEHIARQLALGLTPVTYKAEKNVVAPQGPSGIPQGASGADVSALIAHRQMQAMGLLTDLMEARATLANMPSSWKVDLPRLLRAFLTPGRGGSSIVKFDPADTKPCALDEAMRNRPPALGLVHELIHAWHNSIGRSLRLAMTGKEKLEEVVTTGLPPYNFEEYSDNKFRALWNESVVALRKQY